MDLYLIECLLLSTTPSFRSTQATVFADRLPPPGCQQFVRAGEGELGAKPGLRQRRWKSTTHAHLGGAPQSGRRPACPKGVRRGAGAGGDQGREGETRAHWTRWVTSGGFVRVGIGNGWPELEWKNHSIAGRPANTLVVANNGGSRLKQRLFRTTDWTQFAVVPKFVCLALEHNEKQTFRSSNAEVQSFVCECVCWALTPSFPPTLPPVKHTHSHTVATSCGGERVFVARTLNATNLRVRLVTNPAHNHSVHPRWLIENCANTISMLKPQWATDLWVGRLWVGALALGP